MKLIELLFYINDNVPLKITTENNKIIILCNRNEVEKILKENEHKYKNLSYFVLEKNIKKIDYDGEYERIEIILEEN